MSPEHKKDKGNKEKKSPLPENHVNPRVNIELPEIRSTVGTQRLGLINPRRVPNHVSSTVQSRQGLFRPPEENGSTSSSGHAEGVQTESMFANVT
jgi:hypothetical protein